MRLTRWVPCARFSAQALDPSCVARRRGAVAQLGEYLTGSQGVEGSNPSSSTIGNQKKSRRLAPPASSSLG